MTKSSSSESSSNDKGRDEEYQVKGQPMAHDGEYSKSNNNNNYRQVS